MAAKKELHAMTVEELGALFPIILVDYSEQWVELYQSERKRMLDSFPASAVFRMDHIGSTAIPGIQAKPTIDILLQISEGMDIPTLKKVFTSLGYSINEHPDNPPPHLTFVKGYTPQGFKGQTYHVHLRYPGDWEEIRFRDYLICHPETAKAYETLKRVLAEKYKNDREAYTNAKADFVQKINALTRK